MKQKAKITISRPQYGDGTRKISITVKDTQARHRFLSIEIDYDSFAECLTGLSETECEMEVRNLERVGKTREIMNIEFKMPGSSYGNKGIARAEVKKHLPEGWQSSDYFSSQNSFFKKDDVNYARTDAYRWVEGSK